MENIIFEVNHLNLFYGEKQALMDLNMKIEKNAITALIGPVRLRKVHVSEMPEPHERSDRWLPRGR